LLAALAWATLRASGLATPWSRFEQEDAAASASAAVS
jgi:hypothetical protein